MSGVSSGQGSNQHGRLPPRSLVTACGLFAGALLLYGAGVGAPSRPLSPDERTLAAQARTIATTAHDRDGRLLPLYLHAAEAVWLPPIPVYVTALFLTALPDGEATVRWPSVAIGALNVALIYVLARRLLAHEALAVIAAGLLLLTPAHFMFSRTAGDAVYQLPFVLGWLLCLVRYLELSRPRDLVAGTLLLGAGTYAATSAPITMTAYFVLTGLALQLRGRATTRDYAAAAAGFVVPLLLLLPWFAFYPATYVDTLGRWAIHPAHLRNPMEGLRALVNWGTLGNRATLYWALLNPAFLFLPMPAPSPGVTPAPWVLLTPVAGLMLAGGYQMMTARLPVTRLVLFGGYALAPLAACTFGEADAIGRAPALLAFAVLIGAAGADWLVSAPRTLTRAAGIGLLALVPVQFAWFHHQSVANSPARTTVSDPK